jgi:hypothetical protein
MRHRILVCFQGARPIIAAVFSTLALQAGAGGVTCTEPFSP